MVSGPGSGAAVGSVGSGFFSGTALGSDLGLVVHLALALVHSWALFMSLALDQVQPWALDMAQVHFIYNNTLPILSQSILKSC